jgi:hypothetical protein
MMEANLRSLERGNQVADDQQLYFKAMQTTRNNNEKQPVKSFMFPPIQQTSIERNPFEVA